MARVRCSIELEPRTLNELELNDAREAAIDIVQKQAESSYEASNIFSEEPRPFISIKEMEEKENRPVVGKESTTSATPGVNIDQRRPDYCANCNSTITLDETPDHNFNIREPLSAPF